MNEIASQLVIGYHGCDKTVGEKILTGDVEHLRPSSNKYDWLGSGIYFWERDEVRAREYAEHVADTRHEPRIETPFVIGAVIELGRCVDLLQRENLKLVGDAFEFLKESCKSNGKKLPRNRPAETGPDLLIRNLDCAVIDAMHAFLESTKQPPCDTVRAAFWEGHELYPTAGFRAQNHVQICVRNPNCIKGYFRPLRKVASHPLPGADA